MLELQEYVIRCAVRIARRVGSSEDEIRSMVRAEIEPTEAIVRELSPEALGIRAVVRTYQGLLLSGRPQEDALAYLKRRSGTHLDASIVGEFLDIVRGDAVAAWLRPGDRPGRKEEVAA